MCYHGVRSFSLRGSEFPPYSWPLLISSFFFLFSFFSFCPFFFLLHIFPDSAMYFNIFILNFIQNIYVCIWIGERPFQISLVYDVDKKSYLQLNFSINLAYIMWLCWPEVGCLYPSILFLQHTVGIYGKCNLQK